MNVSGKSIHGDHPLVTVLLPVYNGRRYLREAIDSILCQTLDDFELLIVDDGSTDGSGELVSEFTDPRIRLVVQNTNQGLVSALNLGIDKARGTYIARMDADDISLPNRLERQVSFMTENPSVGICGSWIEAFSNNKSTLWSVPLKHEAIVARLLFESALFHPTVIIRKARLVENDLIYSSDFSRAQDYEFWSKCTHHCQLANIGEVLLHYRLHDKSVGSLESAAQLEFADKVRSAWLKKLRLQPTDDELVIHRKLSLGDIEVSDAFLERAQHWLRKIEEANDIHGIFSQVDLLSELASRWFLVCTRTTQLGLSTIQKYLHSPLSRHFPGSRLDVMSLAAKSALRWSGK